MNETSNENLLSEGFYHFLDDVVFVEVEFSEFIFVGDFYAVDPLSNEDSFSGELIENLWNTDIIFPQSSEPIFSLSCILSLYSEVNFFSEHFFNRL